jgi:NADPH:quinone reductase-like Zn-dependent oxidoreductase
MERMMKAIVYETYGPPEVLHIDSVDKPVPGDNDVLIKVHASSVTKFDCWMRSCTSPPGFNLLMRIASGLTPKQPILGTELSGTVESAGKDVHRIAVGDQVFGFTGMNLGAYAEYISLPKEAVAKMPNNANFEEAACLLEGAMTAQYFLSKANIQPGQKVLVFGASGGVGGFTVQLAKHYYHAEVTGVCSSSKMAYVRSLGADHVIDYTKEDFTCNGEIYDVIFDTVGKSSIRRTKGSLKPTGWYLLATFGLPMLLQLLWLSATSKINMEYGTFAETADDLIFIRELVESGTIKPTIDRCFPMEQAAEAHRYVESGQKIGQVVITIQPDSEYPAD